MSLWTPTQVLQFAAVASTSSFENWHGRCGEFCAMAHSFGGSGYASAAAQGRTLSLNRNQSAAKPGDVHFWTEQGSWDAGFGHIAIQSSTPGHIWSNDLVRDGHIDYTSITGPVNIWGQTYMGFADGTNPATWAQSWGTNPYWSPGPAPKPTPPPVPPSRTPLDEDVRK